jgi:hypothetical protein
VHDTLAALERTLCLAPVDTENLASALPLLLRFLSRTLPSCRQNAWHSIFWVMVVAGGKIFFRV